MRDASALQSALADTDILVHAAAALPLWSRRDILETNVDGTRNALDAVRRLKIPRMIQISSTAVYGVPKVHPLDEAFPLHGVGPYGHSKIAAEKLCEEARSDGLCVTVIRPKTFIGNGRLGVFQILYDWVESGKRIPVIGRGRNRYQLLEVRDLVDAILLAAAAPVEAASDTFNVGAREFGTVRDDLGALCDYAATGARVIGTPALPVKALLATLEALHLSPLYKWVYGTADRDSYVSTEKIEARLGWAPKYSNAQALIESYRWYRENSGSIQTGTGVTHRVAWEPGLLRLFKRWL